MNIQSNIKYKDTNVNITIDWIDGWNGKAIIRCLNKVFVYYVCDGFFIISDYLKEKDKWVSSHNITNYKNIVNMRKKINGIILNDLKDNLPALVKD